jgi:hypothetical protein
VVALVEAAEAADAAPVVAAAVAEAVVVDAADAAAVVAQRRLVVQPRPALMLPNSSRRPALLARPAERPATSAPS